MSSPWKSLVIACALSTGCEDAANEPEQEPADASMPVTITRRMEDAAAARDATQPGMDARPDGGDVPSWRVPHPSFEQALRVEPDGSPNLIDERSADQVDYFVFRGRAGAYYEILTDRGEFTPDNTLELYDAQRRKLGANDDGARFPGDDIDARLVVRLQADGDYYVRVEDLQTPAELFSSALPLLYYHISVRELTASSEAYAVWNQGSTLPFVEDDEYGYHYVTVIGELRAGGGAITFDSPVANALIARIHAGGVEGNGSSVSSGAVRVESQGKRVSEIVRTLHEDFHPPVAAGTVDVSIEAPEPLGDNPFYAVDLVLLKDNPSERAEPNESAERAESITLSRATTGRGLLLSRLPAGDVDLWRIPVVTASRVIFSCEAASGGSGLQGLHVELLDAELAPLTDASEDEDGLAGQYEGSLTGPLFLRVRGAGAAAALEPWVRCVVIAG